MARELHAALKKDGLQGPYVLVGHSAGAYHVRVFADMFPDDVVGMVLLDPSHEDQQARFPPEFNVMADEIDRMILMYKTMTFFGISRITGLFKSAGLPEAQRPAAIARANRYSEIQAAAAEMLAMTQCSDQTRATGSLRDLPLTVMTGAKKQEPIPGLTAEVEEEAARVWLEMHRELTALSTRGKHVITEKSGHMLQYEVPDEVIQQVREMVTSLQQGTPAPQEGAEGAEDAVHQK